MKNLIITLCFFSLCLSENLTLRESLQGYWKRVEVNRSNVEYLDSDDIYTVYNIFNNSINTFYSFRKNEFYKGYTLENHLISDINYISSGIKKNSGKVLLGFEGMFSGDKTWKEVVESGGEVFSVEFSTKDRVTLFFSGDYSETYIKLDDGNLPSHLKDILRQTSKDYIEYFENGNIKVKGQYRGGLMIGEWVYYYESGDVKMTGSFIGGDGTQIGKFSNIPINGRHGIWISYYENGNQQVQIDYKNGSKHGKFYEFYENGQIKKEKYYINDIKDGVVYHYYESGKIKLKRYFKNGKKVGKKITYNEDGKIIDTKTY